MRSLVEISAAASFPAPAPGVPLERTGFMRSLRLIGRASLVLMALALLTGNASAIGFFTNPTLPAGNLPSFYSVDFYLSGYQNGSTTTLAPAPGSSLPQGLVLVAINQSHWWLGGVFTTPGNYSFTLNLSDSYHNTASQTFTLAVSALYIDATLPQPSTQLPYDGFLKVYGGTGPYTWSSSNPPAGLTLYPNGELSGTPTTVSPYPASTNFDVSVHDSLGNTGTTTVSLSISSVSISYPASGTAILAAYNQPFALTPLTFGPTPVTLNVYGYPPAGLTIDPNTGIISGTPQEAGLFRLSFNVQSQTDGTRYSADYDLFVQQSGFGVQPPFASDAAFRDATAGLYYSVGLQVNGGAVAFGPLTWSVAAGTSLPPGLNLVVASPSTTSARLVGIPTTPGSYAFAVQVNDSGGSYAQQTINLIVSNLALAPADTNGGCYYNLSATAGVLYQQRFVPIGMSGTTTFSIIGGALPGSMTLDSTGLVSGTSNDSIGATVHIQATNGAQTFSRVCTINVTNSAAPLPIGINTDSFDPFINEGNPPLDLSVGYNSGIQFVVSGAQSPVVWSAEPGSQLPPGMSVAAVSYNSGQNGTLSGTPTTPGYYTFTLRATGGDGQYGLRTFTVHVGLMTNPYWASNLYAGQTGVPFSAQIPVQFGTPPYTFALSPLSHLPYGLTLTADGTITGTAATAGQFYLTYVVTDANGFTINNQIILNIVTPLQTWPFDATSDPRNPIFWDASVGVPFAPPVPLRGVLSQGILPYTWSVTAGSTLPPGINVDNTNILSGIPTQIGQYNFVLTATDGRGRSIDIPFQMNVRQLRIVQTSLAQGTTGVPYSQQLTGAGGMPPYSFTATYGLGCAGLSFTASGLISGTPTQICTGLPTFVLTDALGNTFTRNFLIPIGPPGSATHAAAATPGAVAIPWTINNPLPSPVPIQVVGTPAGLAFTVSTSGASWLSVSSVSGTTPGSFSILVNPVGNVGVYNASVTITVPSAFNSPIVVPVALVVSSSSACSYSVSPSTNVLPAVGGTGGFAVNTQPYCSWTAVASDPANVTFTSVAAGTGTGTVGYAVVANGGTVNRPFTITIPEGSLAYNIVEQGTACSFLASPASLTVPATGGPASVPLSASGASCAWSVTPPSVGWITVDPATAAGTGGGTINLNFAANSGPSARTSSLSVGGVSLAISQAGSSCAASLSPAVDALSSAGGTGRSATLTIPSGCAWTASAPSWITITSAAAGTAGANPTPLTYDVAPNSNMQARSAFLQAGGQSISITEDGVPCSFTVAGDGMVLPATGGSGAIGISATSQSCPWVASSNTSWLSVNPGTAYGNSPLGYTATANPGSATRSGTITVAGQTLAIPQAGSSCSVTLASTEASLAAAGGLNSVAVQAPAGCNWNASSHDTWVAVNTSGSGNGTVYYNVAANATGSARSTTLTISPGASFTVDQAAPVSCTYSTVGSSHVGWSASSGSFSFTVSPTNGCGAPVVQSFASWLSIQDTPSFSGSGGTVSFAAIQNNASGPRTGFIMVGGSPYSVTQDGSPCSYSLNIQEGAFGTAGGPGTVLVTASQGNCSTTVQADPALTNVNLGGSSPNLTLTFTVPVFSAFLPTTRVLSINVGGQQFSVKQVSW